MSETSEVTTPLIEALNRIGCYAERQHAGSVRVSGGWMHLARKGAPDIVACINGRSVYFETKSATGKLRKEQEQAHRRIRAAGGVVYVVRSVREGLDRALEVMRSCA